MTQQDPKYLTTEQIERLLSVIKSPRDRAAFTLAYCRGLRASEVGAIQMSDYQERERRLWVRRLKGSLSGQYRLTDREVRALAAWLKIRRRIGSDGALFISRNHRPISRRRLDELMKHYCSKVGIPENLAHMHTLKHSCATHLLTKGFNVEQVQDWVGHANIQNTMIYARITNARRDQMADQLRGW